MATPGTQISLCRGVPLNVRQEHTILFKTDTEQRAYFFARRHTVLNDYAYTRYKWTLRVAAYAETARLWNYAFFKNPQGKWYFYCITSVQYIHENVTELTLELDVLQTYMFDWSIKPCYVEREHSATDGLGENTIDEGLDTGELVTGAMARLELDNNLSVMMAATIDVNKWYLDNVEDGIIGAKYDGGFSQMQITATKVSDYGMLCDMLYKLNTTGKSDAIFAMWLYPTDLLSTSTGDYADGLFARYVEGSAMKSIDITNRPNYFGEYKPKNMKLYQYPYSFMYATNNSGTAAVYRYEYFKGRPSFTALGNVSPDASITLVPLNYKGVDTNYDEGLLLSNLPQVMTNTDVYKMWLAQNQNTLNFQNAMGGVKIAAGVIATTAGIATGNPTGAAGGFALLTSGASDIAGQLAAKADKEVQPPQAKLSGSGNHNLALGLLQFDIYHKHVDACHAKVIDDYFTMYGYATRRVKIPNLNTRPYWNYVKTIGANIDGDFPQDDLAAIAAIFDRGVTFWHTNDVCNYNLDNSV